MQNQLFLRSCSFFFHFFVKIMKNTFDIFSYNQILSQLLAQSLLYFSQFQNMNQIKLYNYKMFNPKQALERIRKQKTQKQQNQSQVSQQPLNNRSLFPQFQQDYQQNSQRLSYNSKQIKKPSFSSQYNNKNSYHNPQKDDSTLEQRMKKLQSLVSQLSSKLSTSNDTIEQLKQQNHSLEVHILKIQNQNNQLKSSSKYSELKNSLTNRMNSSISGLSENSKFLTSFQNDKNQIKKAQSKVIQDDLFSPEVEDAMQEIKKEPIQNILKRKQHNFRALKNASKDSLLKGQKALKQLSNLCKNYGKNYKKPTLIINLQDADFQ